MQDEARERANQILQMPPVLKAKKDEVSFLSSDPEIEMFDKDDKNYVFTDITYGVAKRVCVRQKLSAKNGKKENQLLNCCSPTKAKASDLFVQMKQVQLGHVPLCLRNKCSFFSQGSCRSHSPTGWFVETRQGVRAATST